MLPRKSISSCQPRNDYHHLRHQLCLHPPMFGSHPPQSHTHTPLRVLNPSTNASKNSFRTPSPMSPTPHLAVVLPLLEQEGRGEDKENDTMTVGRFSESLLAAKPLWSIRALDAPALGIPNSGVLGASPRIRRSRMQRRSLRPRSRRNTRSGSKKMSYRFRPRSKRRLIQKAKRPRPRRRRTTYV